MYLGVLQGQKRTMRIPAQYKRSIMHETRNLSGQGLQKPSRLLIRLELGKVGPTQLLGLKARKT